MDILLIYLKLWSWIPWSNFVIAAVLFILGIVVAPQVLNRDIQFLIKFPAYVFKTLIRYIEQESKTFSLFILIFSFNTFSLFLDFLSGWGFQLPFIFAFLTGLNIAIIAFKLGGYSGILALIMNPVALLELPAAWLSLAWGIKLGQAVRLYGYSEKTFIVFQQGVDTFVFLVIPLLAIAAILEAVLIQYIRNKTDFDDSDADDDFHFW